jgi:ribonuclease Z
LGSAVVAAAAASSGEGESGVVEVGILERDGDDLISRIRGGQKVNKSIITKCKVGELREVCSQLGMEDEGTKPVLIERILGWLDSELASNPRSEEPVVVEDSCATDTDDCATDNEPEEAHGAESAIDSKQREYSDLSQQNMLVTWLGTSSGAPTSRRNVSSMALQLGEDGDVVLVDCGEGTRNQLRSAKMDPARVTHMFITHLHGDHCFGIAGGLTAVMNARRGTPKEGEPFYIYGPPELHRLVLASCRAAQLQLEMPVYVIGWVLDPKKQTRPVLAPGSKMLHLGLQGPDQSRRLNPRAAQHWQKAYDSGSDQVVRNGLTWRTKLPCGVSVVAAQLQHRMPCWGYVFEEPGVEGVKPRKIVLLGDTCNSEAIAKAAMGCDVISHEATYKNG